LGLVVALAMPAMAQKRLVVIDQDGSGPGDSNQMSMLALLQEPTVQVLGITIVTGNAWRDEEVQHTLRMLELTGHSNVPVAPGAVYPLVRTQQETEFDLQRYGKVGWLGAWGKGPTTLVETQNGVVTQTAGATAVHGPDVVPPMVEGAPTIKALEEDAAHFLVRQVHAHPHEVTIYAAGPMTNVALAISIDPHFAEMAKEIVLMGGSLNPQTEDPEFSSDPRHEFNFWFDPEAAHIVLRAHWAKITVTTVDVSIKAPFTQAMYDEISRSKSPAAQYIARYAKDRYYLWDELAACAWMDPTLISKERLVYMDVDVGHGAEYGDTLVWTEKMKPGVDVQLVHAQMDVDMGRFSKMFVDLMSAGGGR
jgi:inosine-uridine nucleoside N-ribohydrolase